MPAPLLAAAIPAAASLIGTGAQVYAAGKMNKKTREWNEYMYGKQRQDALADWNMQNAYNSPEQQMQRLKEAGLNPNLVYGNGADATVGGPPRATNAEAWRPETPNFSGIGEAAKAGIAAYQDFTLQNEQVKNMQAQRQNMELDAALKTMQTASIGIKNSQDQLDLAKNKELYDTSIAEAQERLRGMTITNDVRLTQEARDAAMHAPNLMSAFQRLTQNAANLDVSKQQVENMKQQLNNMRNAAVLQKLDIGLRKLGIQPNDPMILRMLSQFAGGKPLPEAIKGMIDEVKKVPDAVRTGMAQQFDDLISGRMFE